MTCGFLSVKHRSPPCYTTSFWYIIYYHNLHLSFEGSCVTRGGGTVSYKKKLKSLYILSNKCPDGHKNLDYWYLLCKYSPESLKLWCFLYFMNEKFNKNAKVEKLTKKVGRGVRLIVIGLSSCEFVEYTLRSLYKLDQRSKREVPRDVRNSKVRRQDKFRRDWSRH